MGKRFAIARGLGLAAAVAILACTVGEARAQGPGAKPFEDIYRRPNVSPYNQITNFANDPQATANIYEQLVRPQLQQQQQQVEQIRQGRQVGRLQSQVTQIQSDARGRQLDETIRPTGHASTYMNYSHYYRQQQR